ncbi:MAG: bacteriohemerythrin [Methylococcales bacterium]
MSLMTWTVEQHGTNVGFADNEHQQVFQNLNILYDLRTDGAGNTEITEQLKILLGVVAAHFAHEEREMIAKNFIGYERHKIEHIELLDTCTAMEIKIQAGELELTERICQLIKSWFDSHIPEYDRAYSQALNA